MQVCAFQRACYRNADLAAERGLSVANQQEPTRAMACMQAIACHVPKMLGLCNITMVAAGIISGCCSNATLL